MQGTRAILKFILSGSGWSLITPGSGTLAMPGIESGPLCVKLMLQPLSCPVFSLLHWLLQASYILRADAWGTLETVVTFQMNVGILTFRRQSWKGQCKPNHALLSLAALVTVWTGARGATCRPRKEQSIDCGCGWESSDCEQEFCFPASASCESSHLLWVGQMGLSRKPC